MKLDNIDKKILMLLQEEGRATASYVAEKVHLSVPASAERIKKLQETGIIKGFRAVLDTEMLGLDIEALITIVSDSSKYYEKVIKNAKNTSEVVRCFSTTGDGSHVLLIQTQNSKTLESLLRKIQSWPGVIRTHTQLILSSYKELKPIYFE
ncbi:MAG: Lrp/AsnC family transcriptional regulator [Candidatus Marinimicrobia bacterium]|nr:Lrp/AsnC family transcriptional regulator [Candidatus Neomarinimicrobiota bacterium]